MPQSGMTDRDLLAIYRAVQAGSAPPEAMNALTAEQSGRLNQLVASTPRSETGLAYLAGGLPAALAMGAAKGLGRSVVGAGRMMAQIPGLAPLIESLYGLAGAPVKVKQALQDALQQPELTAQDTPERLGMGAEQIAEFAALPTGKVNILAAAPRLLRGAARLAQSAAGSGVLTGVQGGDPKTGAAVGAMAPVVGGAVEGGVNALQRSAVPLVRAGIKPLVSELRKVAGASRVGVNRKANELAQFMIDEGITTAAKAERVIQEAETAVQSAVGSTPTDAPARAARYLDALQRSAAKQGLPEADVRIIAAKARELIRGPHGETILTPTLVPSPILDPTGSPIMMASHKATRALRSEMPADEALATARASGRWGTKKQWGEQKSAATEAAKVIERADRDAVKVAIPEAGPALKREGLGIQAKQALDRGEFRQANRDVVGLPAQIMTAVEISSGRVPIMAVASEYLRHNQVRMGVWADRLAKALQRRDVATVAAIMNRFGVGAATQGTGRE